MPYRAADRVQETTTGTGTGNLTLAGAVAGFQTLAAYGYANNDAGHFTIEAVDANGIPTGEFETSYCVFVSATPALSRKLVIQSSNADALVSFSAGTKRIYSVRPGVTHTPSIVSVGAEFTSTAVPTATLPGTHEINDILVLCIQQANQADYAAPTGYTRMGPQNGLGAAAAAGSTKLSMFWKRDNGAESAPTLTDSGDHTYGFMFAVRGCPSVGDPFHLLGQAFKLATSTTGTSPAGVTSVDNSLIVDVWAHHVDQTGALGSAPTNADLTGYAEQFDDSTTDGTGGGLYMAAGVKSTRGPIVASTVTWGTTSADVSQRIAFIPDGAAERYRPPEIQTFIGSISDLDDTWVKPYGAVRVFAQICDGGQSGSSGNTTTTPAGGGGGGGGGYDEAWFNADNLAATITVHAGRGGTATTALNQAGVVGIVSEFNKGGHGPLVALYRTAGTAATAAASADGGNGGCGAGAGSAAVETARLSLSSLDTGTAMGKRGAPGGSGTTAPVGGSAADWGGGGGESGGDTDAAISAVNNGTSIRGAGGGSGGRTNTIISEPGHGGGAAATFAAQGATGAQSTRLPYGAAGGVNGGSSVVVPGTGGFPGGGGGGGAGVAGGFGGRGGDGCVVVTTHFT